LQTSYQNRLFGNHTKNKAFYYAFAVLRRTCSKLTGPITPAYNTMITQPFSKWRRWPFAISYCVTFGQPRCIYSAIEASASGAKKFCLL